MYVSMYVLGTGDWGLGTGYGKPGRMGLGLDLDLNMGGIAVMGAVDEHGDGAGSGSG